MIDESRIERERHEALATDLDRLGEPDPSSGVSILIDTIDDASAGQYVSATETYPGGAEVEGGSGTFVSSDQSFVVLNVGTTAAPAGRWIAVSVGGRWCING